MVKKVLNIWPIKKKIKLKKSKMHESKFLSLNIEKAKKELNWKPKLTFNETIELTVDWYKNYLENKDMEKITSEQIKFFMRK